MFRSCSNVDKIRKFIKDVYVDRKYAGGKTSDKPPRDTQASSIQAVYFLSQHIQISFFKW